MASVISPTQDKADKLLVYLARKIGEHKPNNVIFFIVDILCTYYPRHIPSFSRIWLMDKNLDDQKQHVRELFKRNNSTSCIAQHFINAGFDSLDALACLTTDVLDEIQAYNNTKWLPGHKVRVHQIFEDIKRLVKEYKDELKAQRTLTHYSDGHVYSQLEGTYITPKRSPVVWYDSKNYMPRGGSVYYYPAMNSIIKGSDSLIQATNANSPSTASYETRQNISSVMDSSKSTGAVNISQIVGISAETAASRVVEEILAKSESEQIATHTTSAAGCCYTNNTL
ncbi:stripes inner membrane complex protein, putative [Babesia caballi]|uniref:Stripes inner membrane complex protein, putative n=1 Tax=Babesia caballi TaxID=5871 RepID=A0AAV4LZ69_BABCB|nr:stripes inner membrane complex protein, putative [Babesia caballi]